MCPRISVVELLIATFIQRAIACIQNEAMACVNISGRFYPPESLWNMTETDDSVEMPILDIPSGAGGGFSSGGNLASNGLNFSSRNSLKNEMPGIVCMINPEQMLEPWEINKNLAMLISYSVIFVIGVLGNVTAMMVLNLLKLTYLSIV